jgi:hypothetical protein
MITAAKKNILLFSISNLDPTDIITAIKTQNSMFITFNETFNKKLK